MQQQGVNIRAVQHNRELLHLPPQQDWTGVVCFLWIFAIPTMFLVGYWLVRSAVRQGTYQALSRHYSEMMTAQRQQAQADEQARQLLQGSGTRPAQPSSRRT